MRRFYKNGSLKPIPSDNKGLPNLPKEVRAEMGYMQDGGRVKKMGGGMMEEAKEINSKIKNSRTLKMGGGMMKRPMYKAGSSNPKATSETAKKQAKAGMESQKTSTKTKIAKKILNPLNLKGAVEGYKKLGSKIKDKFTKKKLMGGGRVKRAAGGPGLYANIKAKKDRIAAGSGEKMRKVGTKGAPTAQNFINAAKTAKKV